MVKAENIFKVISPETGEEVFVEIIERREGNKKPFPDAIYVQTRTPWPTSIFAQVESDGWIEQSKLIALSEKKDKKMLERIKEVDKRQRQISQGWFEDYKGCKGKESPLITREEESKMSKYCGNFE